MSYSSCGLADGGSVASRDPVALGLLAGGGGNCPGAPLAAAGCGSDTFDRSSGAPASRPPGAPIDGAALTGPAEAVSVPSTRGAPGAVGCWRGSKASDRWPGAAFGGIACCGMDCGVGCPAGRCGISEPGCGPGAACGAMPARCCN